MHTLKREDVNNSIDRLNRTRFRNNEHKLSLDYFPLILNVKNENHSTLIPISANPLQNNGSVVNFPKNIDLISIFHLNICKCPMKLNTNALWQLMNTKSELNSMHFIGYVWTSSANHSWCGNAEWNECWKFTETISRKIPHRLRLVPRTDIQQKGQGQQRRFAQKFRNE